MTQVTISKGFEWFRYQLGPLDYANLPARFNDGIKSYYWTCGSTLRMAAVNQPIQITSQNATGNVLLTLTPQPITQTATISLNNFNCDNPQAVTLQCYDATGRAMDILAVTKADSTEYGTLLYLEKTNLTYDGLLLVKVMYQGYTLGTIKALTLKNK